MRIRHYGFTLVELVITLVVALIVSGAAYAAYVVQQRNSTVQEQVAEMQQNIRAGLDLMTREMRMAGYDPTFSGLYGIVAATPGSLTFTADLCENGGSPGNCVLGGQSFTETFRYELYDSSGDGTNDALRRTPGGSAIAENIEQLEFRYLLGNGVKTAAPLPNQLARITGVEISVLVRADEEDHRHRNTRTYTTASGRILGPFNDKYRRRLHITTLQFRNLGH